MSEATRINDFNALKRIRDLMAERMSIRELNNGETSVNGAYDIMLCMGTSCISSGAEKVKKALQDEIERAGLNKNVNVYCGNCSANDKHSTSNVELVATGCNGFCANGPIIVMYPGGFFYQKVQPSDAKEIIHDHVINNKPVERLQFKDPQNNERIPFLKDIPFFGRQTLNVLRNKGRIAADSIDEYIGRQGYLALNKVLHSMTPGEVIETVKASGLKGRGGAGFPTGAKWEFCAKEKSDIKYILCNADEGDPGAFMDRSLIESDPHALLEGIMIAGYAIGAKCGYVYCRAEYPLALQRLGNAIDACRQRGLLGKNILGSDFSIDIHIAKGAGAFVCGEETALMRSIEGKRGIPRTRPPFPAQKGLWDKPTVLNNVETLGAIAGIIRDGAENFKKNGTEKSPGTKIFALTGNLNNIGLIEVPIGIPLGEIIYEIGGGIPEGRKYKAAQIGGPSGGCIPKQNLGVLVDYDTLNNLGAIMGSGGLVVMDENTCMVDMAKFFLEFVQEESCGKCTPCRIGTKNMLDIMEKICNGDGREGDVEKLVQLGKVIAKTSLCGLGQTAANPVLSTIRHFRDEYDEHIREKKCRAGVCPGLVRAPCNSACPAGVNIPGFISLTGEKRFDEALKLHREQNPLAAICGRVCFHPCETPCRRAKLDEAVSVRGIKRYMTEHADNKLIIPEVKTNKINEAKKIAVIGSGPSGLTCAYYLARMGYRPDIFESGTKAGGMLIQSIPAYRLPREVLNDEIQMIFNMGVKIHFNSELGRDFTLTSLKEQGYDAVFIGIGAPIGWKLGISGEDATGVTEALSFLREYNESGRVNVGKNVIVIGGGNAAMDAARTALRLGAEKVTIVYRRTRESMPAFIEEIEEAEKEGIDIKELLNPVEIIVEAGKATGLKCSIMQLGEYDASGRRKPKQFSKEHIIIKADQIIAAIGQDIDVRYIAGDIDIETWNNGYIKSDKLNCKTSIPWIFAGGDAVTGPSSVIEAIAAGEKGAVGIDELLSGESHAFWRVLKSPSTAFDPDAEPTNDGREDCQILPLGTRKNNFSEIEIGYSEKAAIAQAKRCLRCDYGK